MNSSQTDRMNKFIHFKSSIYPSPPNQLLVKDTPGHIINTLNRIGPALNIRTVPWPAQVESMRCRKLAIFSVGSAPSRNTILVKPIPANAISTCGRRPHCLYVKVGRGRAIPPINSTSQNEE